MGIFITSLLALSTTFPQQPPPASPTTQLAHQLPADVLAAVLTADPQGKLGGQLPGAIGQLWRLHGAPMARQLLGQALGQPLPDDAFDQALARGMALGFAGVQADNRPGLLMTCATDKASATIAAALAAAPERVELDGVQVATLQFERLGRVLVAMRGDRLLLATHEVGMTSLLSLAKKGANGGLADDPGFIACAAEARHEAPLAALFVRPQQLLQSIDQAVPPTYRARTEQAMHALGLDRIGDVFASWQVVGGELVGRIRSGGGAPQGLLAAVAGMPYRLDAKLSRYVPAEADGFVAAAVDVGSVAEQLLGLLSLLPPPFDGQVAAITTQLRDAHGIDLQQDLLRGFANNLLALSFPADGAPHGGIILEVKDANRFAAMLQALATAAPNAISEGYNGVTMCLLPTQGWTPGIAVVEQQLLLASDRDTLLRLVDTVQHPTSNPEVQQFLTKLPPTVTWASRSRAGSAVRNLMHAAGAGTEAAATNNLEWHTVAVDELGLVVAGSSTLPQLLQVALGDSPRMDGQPTAPVVIVTEPAKPVAAATEPTSPAPGVEAATPPSAEDLKALAEVEAAAKPPVNKLMFLLHSSNPAVVARTAWFVGKRRVKDTIPALGEQLGSATDPLVRLHCAAALYQMPDGRALAAAQKALGDDEPRVRTLAGLLLGRLQAKSAIEPLLVMLDEREQIADSPTRVDEVAAILALADIGDASVLMRAASAINRDDTGIGQALAYLFQTHSATLAKKEEVNLLLAVLDHPSTLLRRYSIQRLGELRDPATASRLQGRLASEERELQPLLQVALEAVSGATSSSGDGAWEQFQANASALATKAKARWDGLDQNRKLMLLGCAVAALLALLGFARLRARSKRRARADAIAALVTASPDLLEVGDEPALDEEQTDEEQYEYEEVAVGEDGER